METDAGMAIECIVRGSRQQRIVREIICAGHIGTGRVSPRGHRSAVFKPVRRVVCRPDKRPIQRRRGAFNLNASLFHEDVARKACRITKDKRTGASLAQPPRTAHGRILHERASGGDLDGRCLNTSHVKRHPV